MSHHLRLAARLARKNPGTTLAAFLALALGIGSSTAIFSVVNSVLLRPLPVRDGGRLVRLYSVDSSSPEDNLSMADYVDWKRTLRCFSGMTLYRTRQATYRGSSVPERILTLETENNFLPLLGISPVVGHNFSADADQPGRGHEAILTFPFWQTHFGGQDVIGRRLMLDDEAYTIVGVLPRSFTLFGKRDVMLPLTFDLSKYENKRGHHNYEGIARLAPGVSIAQASSELAASAAQLARNFPRENANVSTRVVDLRSSLTGEGLGASQKHIRFDLLVLLAAVLAVLAIACANVAHLQLIRAWARQREMAVRLALGASRGQLFRQLLGESLLLSLSGGAAGVLIAFALVRFFRHLPVNAIPRFEETSLDWRVLLFALVIALLTGVGFGIAPAMRATRLNVNDLLKESGVRTTASRAQLRLRQLLVLGEIAISVALLVECALLLKSFDALLHIRPEFAEDQLLTFYLALPPARYNLHDFVGSTARVDALLKTIEDTPGVRAAALASDLPLSGTASGAGVLFEDRQVPQQFWTAPFVTNLQVSPGYFRALGVPLLAGREFEQRERLERIVLVNRAFVRKFYPRESPVGRRIALATESPRWQQIIGVVGDVPAGNIEDQTAPQIYFPLTMPTVPWVGVVVRTEGDPVRLLTNLRSAIARTDPSVPVFLPRTMEEIRAKQFFWRKLETWLLSTFAGFALLLAALGIYAVIAYSVRQRTSEIGLRMALGATVQQVWRETLWQGLQPVLAGALIGVFLGFTAARITVNLFFATKPTDPLAYIATVVFILFVAILASAIPATRAARTAPAHALRHE